ncbi:MAG TPA: hypothetical protein VGU71_11225 [Candidatus Dormibacteraeota bacterium]|nr:hypothetical protein [Candidatus Dormibacteraeota bacterium]
MPTYASLSLAKHGAVAVAAGAALLAALAGCDPTFGLGQPTTRALESGAADTLTAANSFEITGTFSESGDSTLPSQASNARTNVPSPTTTWTIDLQVARPDGQHVVISATGVKLEAIIVGYDAYFRGNEYLSQHMGSDPLSRTLVKAAGNAWWKGSAGHVPRLPDFTDGSSFRTTFLGTAATQRTDHASVDGLNAIELSGPRADVFIAAEAPYHLLRVQLKKGVVIDGLSDADLRFNNFDRHFQIAAPTDVINFSNLSTLPPLYTVVSVDTSGCASPCAVSALVKNLGGRSGARAPSTITFTMTAAASGNVIGTCQAQVTPDVGYNATATVSCTIGNLNGQQESAAIVTAVADNPGRA